MWPRPCVGVVRSHAPGGAVQFVATPLDWGVMGVACGHAPGSVG